jgi:2-polyprenyl-3-methyl-5-hydroxy-6-metoxy-1,4-benzoquinol methylase
MNNNTSDIYTYADTASSYIAWKSWQSEEFFTCSKVNKAYFESEMRSLGIRLSPDSRVLEIGFGNGSFAKWVSEITSFYMATEVNPELLDRARQAGLEVYPGTLDISGISDKSFDIIAIFDVVEHLDINEILSLLQSCRTRLSDSGRIIIRIPSGDSPFALHLAHGDITHRTILGSMALRQIGALTHLDVVVTKDAAFPVWGMGVAVFLRRVVIRCARAVIGKFVRLVFYGNEPMVIHPNMVAVLRKKI